MNTNVIPFPQRPRSLAQEVSAGGETGPTRPSGAFAQARLHAEPALWPDPRPASPDESRVCEACDGLGTLTGADFGLIGLVSETGVPLAIPCILCAAGDPGPQPAPHSAHRGRARLRLVVSSLPMPD